MRRMDPAMTLVSEPGSSWTSALLTSLPPGRLSQVTPRHHPRSDQQSVAGGQLGAEDVASAWCQLPSLPVAQTDDPRFGHGDRYPRRYPAAGGDLQLPSSRAQGRYGREDRRTWDLLRSSDDQNAAAFLLTFGSIDVGQRHAPKQRRGDSNRTPCAHRGATGVSGALVTGWPPAST